jgi:hypothetical protein
MSEYSGEKVTVRLADYPLAQQQMFPASVLKPGQTHRRIQALQGF